MNHVSLEGKKVDALTNHVYFWKIFNQCDVLHLQDYNGIFFQLFSHFVSVSKYNMNLFTVKIVSVFKSLMVVYLANFLELLKLT